MFFISTLNKKKTKYCSGSYNLRTIGGSIKAVITYQYEKNDWSKHKFVVNIKLGYIFPIHFVIKNNKIISNNNFITDLPEELLQKATKALCLYNQIDIQNFQLHFSPQKLSLKRKDTELLFFDKESMFFYNMNLAPSLSNLHKRIQCEENIMINYKNFHLNCTNIFKEYIVIKDGTLLIKNTPIYNIKNLKKPQFFLLKRLPNISLIKERNILKFFWNDHLLLLFKNIV